MKQRNSASCRKVTHSSPLPRLFGADNNADVFALFRFAFRYAESDLNIHRKQSCTLEYKVKGHDKVVVYWLAELRNPAQEAKLSDEHQDMKWLDCDEAIQIAGYEDFAKMVRAFDAKIKANEL